jgi:hypothetical protein
MVDQKTPNELTCALFRSLLLIYPRGFRRDYGGEMERVFRNRLLELGPHGGARRLFGLWAHTLPDILTTAAAEHFDRLGRGAREGQRWMLQSPAFPVLTLAILAVALGSWSGLFYGIYANLSARLESPAGPVALPPGFPAVFLMLASALAAVFLLCAFHVATSPTRRELRYWSYFLAKTSAGLISAAALGLLLLDPQDRIAAGGWWERISELVALWTTLSLCCGAMYWSLVDQQSRCRHCLRRLWMPVTIGSWASLVINRPGTDYVCPLGHGKLYVPGTHLLPLDSMHWTVT